MTVENNQQERIAKFMARCGYCSRREAERIIAEGRVAIDGKIIDTPALKVSGDNEVKVDGNVLSPPDHLRVWLFHKPLGAVTTNKDPEGRKTVFDLLPPKLPRVISVGRLDINSEGLLIMTNSGAFARHLELPKNEWERTYRVRVYGRLDQKKLKSLKKGCTVDGVRYQGIDVKVDSQGNTNSWLTVSLKEGKNREVRKVMEFCGLKVNRLIRVAYGPFELGDLPIGQIKEVSDRVVKEQFGNID